MSLILESPTYVNWNLPSCADCKNSYGSAMYFDVTREELLKLISDYEAENSLLSLAKKSGITYAALIDFKRGKSSMLGDKNLRAVMAILRPQAKRDESAPLLERAALLAAEYVESLSAADRKAVTPKKFGKFVACLYAVLMEQQNSGHDPIPPGDTMMRMILSQAGHD